MAGNRTGNRTPSVTRDPDALARVVTDAAILGVGKAAKKHRCSERTVERYKAAAKGDPVVSALVAAKKKSIDDDWRDEAVAFLRDAVTKLGVLVSMATAEQIREVAGAIKIVGELTVAKDVLGSDGDQSRPDSARPKDAETASGADSVTAPVH